RHDTVFREQAGDRCIALRHERVNHRQIWILVLTRFDRGFEKTKRESVITEDIRLIEYAAPDGIDVLRCAEAPADFDDASLACQPRRYLQLRRPQKTGPQSEPGRD